MYTVVCVLRVGVSEMLRELQSVGGLSALIMVKCHKSDDELEKDD
jgi:hypothetical protein